MVCERELCLPHLRLAAREWGPQGGRPVLAIHGWLDNAASFDRLAPLLPELHLVAIDLPGHGRSQHRPAGVGFYFPDWVADVIAALDALGWQQATLLGHSMGAGIAPLVASVCGGRVERLILLEGLGPLTVPAAEAPERLASALDREQRFAATSPRTLPSLDAAISARMQGNDLDLESARLLIERAVVFNDDGICFAHDPRLRGHSRLYLNEDQVLAFLARISCPVLAVRAGNGWPFTPAQIAARVAAVPDLQLVEVAGGHHVHLTDAEVVAPLIRDFLQ
jgi:pimeloyl-ACP methyl ester carboxylesterase